MPDDNRLSRSPDLTLFWIGGLALFTAATNAALRAAVAHELKNRYIDPVDSIHSAALIGNALGAAFLGFALTLAATSFLLDRLGFKAMLSFAAAALIVGNSITLSCGLFGSSAYQAIWFGMFVSGLGWGATEGSVNPLIVTLFADQRTHRLNMLHAYFPAGIVAGGLIGEFSGRLGLDWRLALGVVPVLALAFGGLALTHRFPPTASTALGMRTNDKALEFVRRPAFFIWFGLMFLTSATELAPGQWVDVALSNVVGMRGILLLVYVSGLMFIGRHFAGRLVHRLSSEGLLCISSIFATVGLYLLSVANSPLSALIAATCWGLGVCYLWPTMMSVVAGRYPRASTWAVGMMGLAGALSSYFVLPMLGQIYDSAKLEAAGGADALAALDPNALGKVEAFAAATSFQSIAVLPAVLIVAFAILWLARAKPARESGRAADHVTIQ